MNLKSYNKWNEVQEGSQRVRVREEDHLVQGVQRGQSVQGVQRVQEVILLFIIT
jgi:hypothetical protein